MVASDRSSPSLLVGRERELGILRAHLAATIAGRGSLALIGGEAGIGKTSLAEALCHEAAEQDALVLVGRCYDLTETPPYGPWVDLFARSRFADDAALPDAFAQRGTSGAVTSQAALFQQVWDTLAGLARQRPVVLLLEDLHWADPASLDLLRFIARTVTEHRLLVLATFRGEEVARQHPLSILLPLLVREADAQRLDLWPLDVAAVLSLVADRFRLTDADATRLVNYLAAKAEGNALFIGELLRALEETGVLRRSGATWTLGGLSESPVPPSLRQVIGARLDRLDAESQRLLAVAAVIGQDVPYVVWAAVTGMDEDALLDAVAGMEAAHLMADNRDGSGATFAHALVREAVYEQVRPSQRRRWHRAAGEALATLRESNPDAIAYHFQRAGDDRAMLWLITAAERGGAVRAGGEHLRRQRRHRAAGVAPHPSCPALSNQ